MALWSGGGRTFCDEVGHDNATLIMHTDPGDPHGQPLEFSSARVRS